MKKKNLIVLLASMGLLLASCGKQPEPEPEPEPGPEPVEPTEGIDHQSPFVKTVENPSVTRAFRDDFDLMIEDFSSETPSGEKSTSAVYNKSTLRVLVDSEDVDEPKSPDAAIYKMATGSYEIHNFEGIGFKMRKVGNGELNLSNLVLGLRGDDAFKVYPINLANAKDADGENLPELTSEFQDFVIAPGLSIEEANTVYELAAGGASDTKVLDKILGFHLYALDEECSAVVEIEEVYLINAGDKTFLDTFGRENVGQADTTCWWRGSTGFIVQQGVTLNNATYTTKAIELGEYQNLVMNVSGDTTGLKINNIAYASLKDSENATLTGAVNGAFYSYVINLTNSELALSEGKFVIESTTEVVISQLFLTNLQTELPAEDYPYIDTLNASYVTDFEFTIAKGTVKTNYDDAVADTRVTDTGLNYMISYNNGSEIEVDGHDLVISGGEYDYANLVIGSNANASSKYLVMAIKANAKPSGLRIKLGNAASEVWVNDMLADAGLPSWSDAANYPYVTADGYKLVIVDLERSGQSGGNNEVQLWYTGTEDLKIGSIFFCNAYKPDAIITENTLNTFNIEAGEGYAYVGNVNVSGLRYLKIETTATSANALRFGLGGQDISIASGKLVDADGETVLATATEFTLDLVESHIVLDNDLFHIHSDKSDTAFTVTVKSHIITPQVEERIVQLGNYNIEAGEGYAYVGNVDVTGVKYLKVESNVVPANELRFGLGGQDISVGTGNLIDNEGNHIAADANTFILDIEASGIVLDNGLFHIHSTKSTNAFSIKVSSYELKPLTIIKNVGSEANYNIEAGEGYAYVGNVNVTGAKAVKITTTAVAANELRFGLGDQAISLASGKLIGIDGNAIPATATEFTIDLEATGIVLDNGFFHIHSTKSTAAFELTAQAVTYFDAGSYAHLLSAYNG